MPGEAGGGGCSRYAPAATACGHSWGRRGPQEMRIRYMQAAARERAPCVQAQLQPRAAPVTWRTRQRALCSHPLPWVAERLHARLDSVYRVHGGVLHNASHRAGHHVLRGGERGAGGCALSAAELWV